MKLIHLDKNYEIKLKSKITAFLNPDYIYIPIKKEEISLLKKKKIKKGELLFSNVYSPVSGNIIGIQECTLWNNTISKCLVIENDFKELISNRKAVRKKINNLSKEDIKKDLIDIHFNKIIKDNHLKYIIICGIDDEPYIANEIFTQKENTKIILETIDMLSNIYQNAQVMIVIKNLDGENIAAYNNFLGTYPNIKLRLVEDLYLIGEEQNLLTRLHIKDNYLFLKASELFTLYTNLKKRKPITEKYLTITGDAIENPQVFNVKIGTKIIDILKNFYNIPINEFDIYSNGLMKGAQLDIENLIVSKELDGIVIMKKKKVKAQNCIKCGKCVEICPIGSNPLLAYEKSKKVKCIHCGLCTYICPVYINLRKYLIGDNYE